MAVALEIIHGVGGYQELPHAVIAPPQFTSILPHV